MEMFREFVSDDLGSGDCGILMFGSGDYGNLMFGSGDGRLDSYTTHKKERYSLL